MKSQAILTLVVMALAACSGQDDRLQARVDKLSVRVAALEAWRGQQAASRAAAAAQPHYLLTVTWTTMGQPAQVTQTPTADEGACAAAKAATMSEQRRLAAEVRAQVEADRQRGVFDNFPTPSASAVCSKQ